MAKLNISISDELKAKCEKIISDNKINNKSAWYEERLREGLGRYEAGRTK